MVTLNSIHPSAIISKLSVLREPVSIGAYATIGSDVKIGTEATIGAYTYIEGPTEIGDRCRISPHTIIGTAPQDLKYRGEKTCLRIGEGNVIREFANINRGTVEGNGETFVGDNNLIMAYVHIAHDCRIGCGNIISNATNIAGHVHVADRVVIGGLTAIHQFCRIGSHAMVAGASAISRDVPPFCLVAGNRASVVGLNLVGLKRSQFTAEEIQRLKRALHLLMNRKLPVQKAMQIVIKEFEGDRNIFQMIQFIESSERGTCLR